jgi:CCR4-NOT transcription complex subunit 6
MYNSANQHLLNGGGHQRFGLPLGVSKPFQHQTHPHGGGHHGQHQDASHAGHGHQNNFSHHQHTHSGGAGVANGAGHYGAHLQNGSTTLYSALDKPPTEHWQLQMQMAQQEREWNQSAPRARNAQGTSKTQVINTASLTTDNEKEERQRPGAESALKPKDQLWTELDLGCNQLRAMTPVLFQYDFLTKLYFNSNRLRVVPSGISRLRSLKILDLSLNEISNLPPSIGMLVNLKELLLFYNKLETLPYEVGNLFQCSVLGVAGNPLNDDLMQIVMEHDSTTLIKHLRENALRKFFPPIDSD